MTLIVASPKCSSKSAKMLAAQLGATYINPYKGFSAVKGEIILNFGCSGGLDGKIYINTPSAVALAIDKLATLKLLSEFTRVVAFTEDINDAEKWLKLGHSVVSREFNKASKSKGTYILSTVEDLYKTPAKFWTLYVPHKMELRINVVYGKIISILEKVGNAEGNFDWKLVRDHTKYPIKSMTTAISDNMGLDFYGADVLIDMKNKPWLLEVNSAPSLFGQTAISFVSAMKGLLK